MTTRYEQLFSKRENWVSLGKLYDNNNQLNLNINFFLQAFSTDSKLIFISLIPYGVLSGMIENNVKEDMIIFTCNGLINSVQEYLNHDGFIVYYVSRNHPVYEDYPKEKKRQDFIDRIYIIHKKNNVPFSNIAHLDPGILSGFRIRCNINSKGHSKRDIDFIDYWSKFDQDDSISITSDLVPRVYFEED